MKRNFAAAVFTLLPLLVLDGLWLSTMLKRFYAPRMGHLLAASPSLPAAGAFYLLYAVGLAVLVVSPAVQSGASASKTLTTGALFGLICYATYDLTNQATLRDWPLSLTVVDMAWGATLTGAASVVAVALTRRFG
jgi:uncharacterized membrane protein